MENIQIIIYSFIQGITEFLPVSSSAHLYLLQESFNWKDNLLLLALGAHLGTFLAILFHNKKFFFYFKYNYYLFYAVVSSIPVIIFGSLIVLFGLKNYDSNIFIIALACIIGGILLEFADNYKNKRIEKKTIQLKDSMLAGAFQVLALIPGMSRSGTIITAMRFLGFSRKLSIEYSLLTGLPVLFAACSFGTYKAVGENNIDFIKLLLVTIISFIAALITIKFFLKWIKKFSFRVFSIYRIILGIVLLIYLNNS